MRKPKVASAWRGEPHERTGVTNPEQFSVVDVFVNDKGSPLELPIIP